MTGSPSSPPSSASTTASNATTARVVLSADEFGVTELFERIPNARVECEPAVANRADHTLLVVEANDQDRDTIETALQDDPTIAMVEEFGGHGNGWRYRVTWGDRTQNIIQRLVEAGVTLLSVHGRAGQWKLRLLAAERTAIRRADEALMKGECTPQYETIGLFDDTRIRDPDLNDTHYETLVTAFEMGYYDIPRGITVEKLAEKLDISHQALSERLRRAHQQLVNISVIDD